METLKQNVGDDQLTIITQSPAREYSDSIPIDLLIDIFLRVPTKSIARFRCVSKFWASILRRPDFTEVFLTKCLTRPRFLFSFKVNKELFVFSAPQPQNLDENCSLVATRYKSFPKYFPTDYISYPLCGLVFLLSLVFLGRRGTKEKTQVICNPVTGKFITLPEVKGTGINKSYFCFDPVKKEFKVLCMTLLRGKVTNTYQVLTLDTGDRLWRTIQDPLSPHIPLYGEICINGVLYYKADLIGRYDYISVIVCFDVRSEKFGFINIDKEMLPGDLGALFNYKGKLGVHRYRYRDHQKEFFLWVLDDAEKHKWSKIICIIPPSWSKRVYMKKICGVTSTGEIVFSPDRLSNPLYLFYYNIERKTFTRIRINGFEEFIKHHKISVGIFLDYVENMKFI